MTMPTHVQNQEYINKLAVARDFVRVEHVIV
jgi:hypothetical protein